MHAAVSGDGSLPNVRNNKMGGINNSVDNPTHYFIQCDFNC